MHVSYEVHAPVQSSREDGVDIECVYSLQLAHQVSLYHGIQRAMTQDVGVSPRNSDRTYCATMSKTQSHVTMFQRNIYTKYTKLL